MSPQKLKINRIGKDLLNNSVVRQVAIGSVGWAAGRVVEEGVYAVGREGLPKPLQPISTSITPFFLMNFVSGFSEIFTHKVEEYGHNHNSEVIYRLSHGLRYAIPLVTLAGYALFETKMNIEMNNVRNDPLVPDLISATAGVVLAMKCANSQNIEANERLGYKTYNISSIAKSIALAHS